MTDPLNDDLAATIEQTRRAEREIFGGLDGQALHRPIREGDWNPKDFQAHLTAWKARQADRFAALREGRELPPPAVEEDELNAEFRAARLDATWEEVVTEADAVADRLVDEIRRADPDTLRSSDRLIGGTFGNGVLHALTHFRWLAEAGVPIDAARVDAFAAEALAMVQAPSLPDRDRVAAIYDVACFYALTHRPELARPLLRDAFRLRPDLREFSKSDPDLTSLSGELDDLAASS
jgi:hypothetical protein